MTAPTYKRTPLTPSTITPPSLNRHHSYTSRPDPRPTDANATAALAIVASRANSPSRRKSSPLPSPVSSTESPLSSMERRTSWEECSKKREGYVSFPDFDLLRAGGEKEGEGERR